MNFIFENDINSKFQQNKREKINQKVEEMEDLHSMVKKELQSELIINNILKRQLKSIDAPQKFTKPKDIKKAQNTNQSLQIINKKGKTQSCQSNVNKRNLKDRILSKGYPTTSKWTKQPTSNKQRMPKRFYVMV